MMLEEKIKRFLHRRFGIHFYEFEYHMDRHSWHYELEKCEFCDKLKIKKERRWW